jgi:hypothetical protein
MEPTSLSSYQESMNRAVQKYINGMAELWEEFTQTTTALQSAFFYGDIRPIEEANDGKLRGDR